MAIIIIIIIIIMAKPSDGVWFNIDPARIDCVVSMSNGFLSEALCYLEIENIFFIPLSDVLFR